MIPHIPVDLVCIDTTNKVSLSERAIEKCLEQATFNSVKLLTNDRSRKFAVVIPPINGIEEYSKFVTRKLHAYVQSSHALIIQYDGYVLNSEVWQKDWLRHDFIGAPFGNSNTVGNGGFSLRSKRLLQATSQIHPFENPHPEDSWICMKRRRDLESLFSIKFADHQVARTFAYEGRGYDGKLWNGMPTPWTGQFGFHSWLTKLPESVDRPTIFHHSGDAGDVIYALPLIKALGGGVLFISPDNRHPYPANTRWARSGAKPEFVESLAALCNQQDYVWATIQTNKVPPATDFDFNVFRDFYRTPRPENFESLYSLHQKAIGVHIPDDVPWLTVDHPYVQPGRDIIVNKTDRYNNPTFPWRELVQRYGSRMLFIGTPQEHLLFGQYGNIPRAKTDTLLDVARWIYGSKLCIMNQSCPLAIAHGLGKRVICAEWKANANTRLKRPDAIYYGEGNLEIPDGWI